MGDMRNIYSLLLSKIGRKRTHGRPDRRWEDNIKMDTEEV
jgi:hypothetical protein